MIDGELYKKDLQGTYWDMNAWMKNVAREGAVDFPQSKKPEKLIQQIIEMCTQPGDLVLDSFLGSGTTAAVAHKTYRRYIGVEMGGHAYSLCKPRLDSIISGTDNSGITKAVNWQVNCTPFVRQYGILLGNGVFCYAKRSTKQTIYTGIQKTGD